MEKSGYYNLVSADQLVTACPVGRLLKGEVLGSRRTNNLIMELVRTHNGGVGIDALQRCETGLMGRVGPRDRSSHIVSSTKQYIIHF